MAPEVTSKGKMATSSSQAVANEQMVMAPPLFASEIYLFSSDINFLNQF